VTAAPSPLQKRFGASIRETRIEQALTQEKLAEKASLTLTFVGEVERGEKMPSLDTVVRLASGLGMSGAELLQRSGL